MLSLAGAALIVHIATSSVACCREVDGQAIERTEALVLERAELVVASSPFLRKRREACVRLEFSISADGTAADTRIAETSGERKLDVAALAALKQFRFMSPEKGEEGERYTLVFNGPVR